ncbi:Uma2 family endonuclease [Nocardia sp. NPDC057668]|uniref:Uma2 family endonuclease n=1 Tax=Nocardia sp. NPDC057668 TaxID=3346202 RepID=UPI00366A81AC
MSVPNLAQPELPEFMTWEELERLPEEIAEQIELWDGRVVWLRRGPGEHQTFTRRVTNALERSARESMSEHPEQCWRVDFENNVFLGDSGKSDFLTPDFLIFQCLSSPYQDVRAADTLLVGEVLSPSNTPPEMGAKKTRYAGAGIPWYWEVSLDPDTSAIARVQAHALELEPGRLVDGVRPLRPANYILAGEWTRSDSDGIEFDYPFPIHIPWSELAF